MKTTITTLLTVIGVSGLLLTAAAQPANGGAGGDNTAAAAPDQPTPPPDANGAAAPDQSAQPPEAAQGQPAPDQGAMNAPETAPAENQPVTSTVILPRGNAPQTLPNRFTPPAQAAAANSNDLNMNFVNAPLDEVLTYLSDAADFIVVLQTQVSGTVTVKGTHMTKDDAVNLLNSELNRNHYAAIRSADGRTLTIMNESDAKTRNIPVKIGSDPNSIPDNDEIATWIIPIRFVEAQLLVSDLSSFVSAQATIVANVAGNSILVTDTQSNIRHLAEIIQAVDNSAESETQIKVFPLQHANPNDVANELSSIFPSGNSTGTQSPIQFGGGRFGGGGRGGGFGGGFGGRGGGFGGGGGLAALFGGGNNPGAATQQRIQKATQVTAVADSRIQAVIVSAPKDLMGEIEGMMDSLDVASDRDQTVATIQLQNGDPAQVASVLQSMFGGSSTSRGGTSSSASSPLLTRIQTGTTTMGQSTTTTSGIGVAGTGGGFGGGARVGGGGGGF